MVSESDYQKLLEVIKAIESEKVKKPAIPMDEYLQGAENLYHWCKDDRELLIGGGLAPILFDEFSMRIGICRESQSIWIKDFKIKKEHVAEWQEKAPLAFKLRDDLVKDFSHAFRTDETLLKQVAKIREGSSQADMIQDLNDLSILGRANIALLEKISFVMTRLDQARETSSEMGSLLAMANGDKQSETESKVIRDRAYTYLKEAFDEIRVCGKYVFRDNKEKLKGYIVPYYKSHR